MDLEFKKNEKGDWVAEFEASSSFNIHLEVQGSGYISVAQRGVDSGKYAKSYVTNIPYNNIDGARVFDCDFAALVYPKWIRITSDSTVDVGVVTFSE